MEEITKEEYKRLLKLKIKGAKEEGQVSYKEAREYALQCMEDYKVVDKGVI